MIWELVLVALGSGGLMAFVQFLIERRDKKVGQLAKILVEMRRQERDSCRTQMLLMMSDYPNEKMELMKIAEHYFNDLKGDWYMTAMFRKHLAENNIEPPVWFNEE